MRPRRGRSAAGATAYAGGSTGLRSLPGCRVATSPCASRTRPPAVSSGPGSPGSARSSGSRPSSRPSAGRGRAGSQEPRPADVRPDRPAVPHHRPARLDRPRPGDASRAARRRLPGPLRHRRRRRRSSTRAEPIDVEAHRAARPSTARTAAPRCTRRCCPRARRRCCPTRCAPAVLWTLDLDADGEQTASTYGGRRCAARDRLDYDGVQQLIDSGTGRRAPAAAARRSGSCGWPSRSSAAA